MMNSGAIPADSGHSSAIPADSGAIPVELPDSGWNLWGTVKYCISICANNVLVSGFRRDLGQYTFVVGIIIVLSPFVDICYLISAFLSWFDFGRLQGRAPFSFFLLLFGSIGGAFSFLSSSSELSM